MDLSESYEEFKQNHPVGSFVEAKVTGRMNGGFFVSIQSAVQGFVDILNYRDDDLPPVNTVEDFPTENSVVQAVVICYRDRDEQVALSTRQSDFDKAIKDN